jgi:hypothetical protein
LSYDEDGSIVIVEAGVLAGMFDAASGLVRFGDPLALVPLKDEHCGVNSWDWPLGAALACALIEKETGGCSDTKIGGEAATPMLRTS